MSRMEKQWSDKEKRLYHRLMTTTLYWISHGYQMLRVDLTSAVGADYSKLRYRYKQLRRNIERDLGFDGVENFIVETSEGNGVLHMILAWRDTTTLIKPRKFFIPKQWLSDEWRKLHDGSYIVYVKEFEIGETSRRRVSRYIVSQYLAGKQGSALVRYSYSWGRTIGYPVAKLWELFKQYHYGYLGKKSDELIARWESFLCGERLEGKFMQALRVDETKHYL